MSRFGAVRTVLLWLAVNSTVLVVLLVIIELMLGNWVRPLSLRSLQRFSIPIGVTHTFDPSVLYSTGGVGVATYTRDGWGLRGSSRSLAEIDVVTLGGSTTDQRYLDDGQTWQTVAQREMRATPRPLVFTNAGVDGHSTVGHSFSLRYWFPLLNGLRPRAVLFYLGTNDVLRVEDRDAYDRSVDASSWRAKSVVFHLFKVVTGNLRAREAGVTHGKARPHPSQFTEQGMLTASDREALANGITSRFVSRVDDLRETVLAGGVFPIFVTQTALGWNANHAAPRGLQDTIHIHGRTMNFADVAFLHQHLNRGLMAHCTSRGIVCFDLARDVEFGADDYYDLVHNTPAGAEKIGRYLAARLSELDGRLLVPRR